MRWRWAIVIPLLCLAQIAPNSAKSPVGGSEETHGKMQETVVKFTEALENKGKQLHETTLEEIIDLFHEAQE